MIFVSFGRMGDTYSFDRQQRGSTAAVAALVAVAAAAVDGGGVREGEKKDNQI